MFPYMELLPGRFIGPRDLKGAKLFPQRYIDVSKRQSGAGDGAHRYRVSVRSGGLAGTPRSPSKVFGHASKEAAVFSMQLFYNPARTKEAVAVVDSHDKVIVVGFIFFFSASVCHLEIFFFFSRKSVLLPSAPSVKRESVLKAAAEIADRPFPS